MSVVISDLFLSNWQILPPFSFKFICLFSCISVFDVGKAKTDEGINYDVLESIKNGWITADKYNSEQFRCHTPNTVVVFSNEKPDIKEAVKDRWRILQIKDDDLIDISKKYTDKM